MYRVYLFPRMLPGNLHPYETVFEAVETDTVLDGIVCEYAGDNRYRCESKLFKDFDSLSEAKGYAAAYAAAPVTVIKSASSLDPAFRFHVALLVSDIALDTWGCTFKVIEEFHPDTALKSVMKTVLGRCE